VTHVQQLLGLAGGAPTEGLEKEGDVEATGIADKAAAAS
jgi:hypothetical protein